MDNFQQPAPPIQSNNVPPLVSPLGTGSPKNKLWIYILIGVVVLIIAVVTGAAFLKNKPQADSPQNNASTTPTNTQVSTPPQFQQTNILENNLGKEDLSKKLTINTWCNKSAENSQSLLAPTQKNYSFKNDGTYNWSHFSDYPEGGGSGNWNFQKTTEDGGIIFLDSGDVIRFFLNKNGTLSLEAMVLDACEPLNISDNYSADKLPKVEPSTLFKQITTNSWYKTNDFDLFRLPSKIELKSNGKYVAEFNADECSYTGFWSLRSNQIIRQVPSDNCDFRTKGKPSFNSYQVKLDRNTIVFEGALYSAIQNPKAGIIWSDLRYSGVVEMKITYQRPIQAGVKNMFNVELKNVSSDNLTFKNFIISQEQYKRTSDSYNAVGSKNTLMSQNFSSLVLAPGKVHSFPLEVTFSGTGEVGITIEVNFEDKTQPYRGYESYVLKF